MNTLPTKSPITTPVATETPHFTRAVFEQTRAFLFANLMNKHDPKDPINDLTLDFVNELERLIN